MALQLDPIYDALFPCPDCSFMAHGPGELEEHEKEHVVSPNATGEAIPVQKIAGPMVGVKPAPRKYTCSTCKEIVVGYGAFMRHRRAHKE